ncbi:hypothetical protein WG908_04570 [Sphingobium sp. AN641]|uniref:hypothetical protein n=1 Tax=Sphingobium sp. AN641 TaxID=3133443 RepID=UPI0030BD2FCD
MTIFRWAALPLLVALLIGVAPAHAQEKTGNKPGFTLPTGSARIVLMRPSISVGEQSTGGMFEPNADWTMQARDNLARAIAAVQGQLGNSVVDIIEPVGADAAALAEYQGLFSTVADQVIVYQFFPGNRLPTKKRKDSFEWTMGPGVATLPGLAGADYALFIATEDQFGSTGRKAVQLLAALGGVSVPVGVHKGFAGLVDIRTGDLVWLNADLQMGGDVRTAEGAQRRVAQLFEGFPGRPVAVAVVAGR